MISAITIVRIALHSEGPCCRIIACVVVEGDIECSTRGFRANLLSRLHSPVTAVLVETKRGRLTASFVGPAGPATVTEFAVEGQITAGSSIISDLCLGE